MKFAIVYKNDNKKTQGLAKKVGAFLKDKGHQVLAKDLVKSDLVITLGGDGTLIHKACEYAPLNVPFVGINTGNLGFLTACELSDWQGALDKLIKGEYFVSERISVDAQIEKAHLRGERSSHLGDEKYRAINEVVVKGLYRVVDLEIKVGRVKLLRILGDGVIIATQTGSTAYSLSSGGPIVDPSLDSLLITPINPIGLPIPSIVLSPDSEVEVGLNKGDDVSLILDGQAHTKLAQGETVRVKSGKYKIKFVYFDKDHFMKSLNVKFGLSNRSVG